MTQKFIDKFYSMADNLENEIEKAFAKREMNTYRKYEQAKHQVNKGLYYLKLQKALRVLAQAYQTDTVPGNLKHLKTKLDVETSLKQYENDWQAIGYYDFTICIPDDVQTTLYEAEVALKKISSYFPTPPELVWEMLDYVWINNAEENILEPSAGMGHIADILRENFPDNALDCVEINYHLVNILGNKKHNAYVGDFLTFTPDKKYHVIVMNPPFEKKQDIDHITRAIQILENGGRLVSIASAGVLNNQDKKSVEFRELIDSYGGEIKKLPDGTFKSSDRPTGVNTVLIHLVKSDDLSDLDKP